MKILDTKGLKYLLDKLKEMIESKVDKDDLPKDAKYTGVISGEIEPANLKAGDEWQKEEVL